MEKPSKLTTKKVVIILVSIFAICGIALGVLVFARNASKVASTEDYGYVNPDETKAETDEGFKIDGVLDEAQYQKNNWLYLHNTEGGADVDIAMTSYYGEKGMYFVYDVTERTPIYVNLDRASYLNSCIEMYFAPSTVTSLSGNSVFEVDLMPTGDMTFKKSNGKGGYVNVATTDDTMAVLGATTKGGDVNTEDCTGYCLELFIPWEYMDKFNLDSASMKDSFVYVDPAHITSFNYAGTDTAVDRYWYFFAQQHGATFSNVYQYFRFDKDGALGTMPTKMTEDEHCSITGDAAVIPGMKTTYTITPEKGYAINSILVNGEEYISKVSYDKEGAALLTIRGKVEGLEIVATTEAVTDGNKTLSGTISISKMGGDSLAGVSASYNGPTGEKPIEFDAAGNFTLTDLKQGYYTITVEKEGYDKLTRGIYLNRDITTELVLEYPAFEVVSGGCWMLDFQNEGIINKFGGAGVILSKDAYSKFTVEANFKFDEELTKEYENNNHFTQQRQGLRIKFSNEKVWHIDVMKENGKYIVQYAKFSGDNTMFGWRGIHEMTAAEIAKFTSEDGIKLEVQRDGKYANVYLDDKLIAVEVLDDEFAKCTAQIGFESWDAKRTILEIPYKITNKTDVNLASGIFKMAKEWDLTNQYKGLLKIPNCDGDAGWIGFLKNYANIDLTLNLKDYIGNKTELRHVVKFTFENKETAAISLTYADNQYKIQSMGDTLFGWRAHHVLTDEQIAKFQSKEGIDLRIVRIGTEMTLYLDGEQVAICDLTKNKKKEASGITADMPAEVAMRHYGNEGHTVEIPFAVKETFNNVTITSVEGVHGKLVTPKQNYIIGDTVKLSGKGNEGYYCIGMKVNGVDVPLNWDGTYTFKATEKAYTVEGTFAKRVFKDSKEWNLLKQNEGVISVPADHDGDSGYVDFYKQYKDIDLTLTTRDYIGNNTKLRTVVKFGFENGETAMFSITYNDNEYKLQAMGDTLYGWGRHHKMTDEQIAKWQSEEGIDFRVVREGTEVLLFLDDALVKVCDLTKTNKGKDTGITADMAATVSIRHYGNNGYAAEIPFEVKDTVDDTIRGTIELPKGGRVDNIIRYYATDLDLTLTVRDYDDAENVAARNDVLFQFENGAHVSFGVCQDPNGSYIIQSMNASKDVVDEEETPFIYKRYQYWGTLTAEETAKYLDGGVEFRLVRIGTELSLYIGDRFVNVADLTNNNRGVTADMPAKVTVRHYDDADVKVEIPVVWTDKIDLVSITCVESNGNKVATNKKNYFVGDTVILSDGAKDGYYCAGMKVNGEDVAMNWNGTYTFKATDKKYTVEGTFKEAVFQPSSRWNLLEQNKKYATNPMDIEGVVSVPAEITSSVNEGDSDWVKTLGKTYGDMDLRLTLRDLTGEKNYRMGVRFDFENGARFTFSLTNTQNGDGSTYEIQTMGGTLYNWKMPGYTLTAEQVASIRSAEGLELRLVRVGDTMDVYLGGVHAWEADLSAGDVKDQKTDIQFRSYGNVGKDVVVDYSIAEAPTPVVINIADTTNGTISTKQKNYFAGETVVLTVKGAKDYYYSSLKVDNNEVTVDANGEYAFEATKASYDVTGSFAPTLFKTNETASWDIMNQHKGLIYQKATVTGNAPNLDFVGSRVNSDTSIIIKAGEDDFNADGTLKDANGDRTAISFWSNTATVGFGINLHTDGKYYIGNSAKYNGYDQSIHTFTAEETRLVKEEGIELRVIRIGSEAKIYLEDKYITTYKLPYAADEKTTTFIKRWDDAGVLAPIGYKFSETIPETVTLDIAKTENGTVTADCKNYLKGEPVTLTVTPDKGYDCTSLLVDDKAITLKDGAYTFTASKATHTVEATFRQRVTVTIADTEHGKITKAAEQYYVGDIVVLTVAGDDGYYYDSLKVNNKDVTLGWDGTYSFKAEETSYSITGNFSKGVFIKKNNSEYNLVNQNVGKLQVPNSDGDSDWIDSANDQYRDVTLTVRDQTPDAKNFRAAVHLKFTNGKIFRVSLTNAKDAKDGAYVIQTMGANNIDGIGNWKVHYDLSDQEDSKILSEAGIEFRVTIIESTAQIYLDGVNVCGFDLSAGDIADKTAAVTLRFYGNKGKDVEIPYILRGTEIPVDVTVDENIANGTFDLNKSKYNVGDEIVITPVGDSGYYYDSLKVNGKEVTVNWDGTYSFKATELSYTITGSFSERTFNDHSEWNLVNQNVGTLLIPSADGDTGWLQSVGQTYGDMDLRVTLRDKNCSADNFRAAVRLSFPNNQWVTFTVTNDRLNTDDPSVYELQNMGGSILDWTNPNVALTSGQVKKLTGEEGLEFRIVRVGETVDIYLDGTHVWTADISKDKNGNASGVKDLKSNIQFRFYGNKGKNVEVPFSVSSVETQTTK